MPDTGRYAVRLAVGPGDLQAAQALRYDVFVRELGGDGPMVDHRAGLEADRYDAHADHLLLTDTARDGAVVGVYRLMRADQAARAGGFYCAGEYDLAPLLTTRRPLLELGRSCLHSDHRGGSAMMVLWQGLARYVADHDIAVLFGVASFHGTDVAALAQPLSILHHRHLAPPDLRVRALAADFQPMDLIPPDRIDARAAMVQTPALIKAYLRLGGFVGEGAFVDHDFNTTDVCLVMDTGRMNVTQARIYGGAR